MARFDERGADSGVSVAGTDQSAVAGGGQYTAPGWVRDGNGCLRRETIHHMGRRLPDFDYASRRIYEITVVLEERRPILGRLVKLGAALSGAGPDGLACSPTGGRVPRWAEGYVDTILFGKGQLEKMVNYLRENPLRRGRVEPPRAVDRR